jgi:hypothetical protein
MANLFLQCDVPVVSCDALGKCNVNLSLTNVSRLKFLLDIASLEAGSLKMNTALEYSTRVVQEGGRGCKKSTLNDLVHLTSLRIPLMNPPIVYNTIYTHQ